MPYPGIEITLNNLSVDFPKPRVAGLLFEIAKVRALSSTVLALLYRLQYSRYGSKNARNPLVRDAVNT